MNKLDLISKQKIYLWLIIFLIILNVIILVLLWTGRQGFPPREMRERPPLERFLADELNLSSEQQDLFNKYREEHFNQMKSIMQKIDIKKKEIFDQIFSKEQDKKKVDQLTDSIGILNTSLEKLRFEHFMKLKSVLKEEQYSKFRKMIDDSMRPKMGENMQPPPPPQKGPGPHMQGNLLLPPVYY